MSKLDYVTIKKKIDYSYIAKMICDMDSNLNVIYRCECRVPCYVATQHNLQPFLKEMFKFTLQPCLYLQCAMHYSFGISLSEFHLNEQVKVCLCYVWVEQY